MLQFVLLPAVAFAGLVDPWAGPPPPVPIWLAGLGLMAAGALLLGRGLLDLGRNLTPMPHPRDDARLVVSGIYAHARHPIYGGIMLTGLGWGVASASILTFVLAVVLAALYGLKAQREEVWLRKPYSGYEAYAAGTKRFLPYLL